MMQLTGKQCPAQSSAMEASAADAVFEKSPKGQVRRPTRPEHVIAFEFLKIHYEEDVKAEIPVQKSDVYSDYERHCSTNNYKPLVAADFGRILKSMFPNARDRRLGSRGSSKYCYVGVKRKSENSTQKSIMSPYSAEDLTKAHQSLVCEWASTVLCRRMQTLEELAKYLLKNRFVQTRSCAALTITASLKDTDELSENQPVNKHRETQLKLQEKLREKLLNKQCTRTSSVDDSESRVFKKEGPFRQTQSTSSTPDPDGALRQIPMQTCSAPGSRRTSPEHAAMSVTSSACTSPVFSEGGVIQKPLYPINCHRNSFDSSLIADNRAVLVNGLTPVNSQCNSAIGSERSTPVAPQYSNTIQMTQAVNGQVRYQSYDPRIQSCPNTPLINYHQKGFDFSQQVMTSITPVHTPTHTPTPTPTQCLSLPNSTRNTPVVPEYQDASERYYQSNPQRSFNSVYQPSLSEQQQQQQHFSQSFPNFQRVEFSRNNNSAFMPIKDGNSASLSNFAESIVQPYNNDVTADYTVSDNDLATHNDGEDLEEISELFDIIDSNSSTDNGERGITSMMSLERSRPLSAQSTQGVVSTPHFPHNQSNQPSTSGSVIYDLLKSGTNHSASSRLNQRFRHHSGPPLGPTAANKYPHIASNGSGMAITGHNMASSALDLNSPPSTPNGNFRPVHTPSRELLMQHHYGSDSQIQQQQQQHMVYPGSRNTNQSPANIALPGRFNGSLVGTMSPPAQPLIKRKRNHSGENVTSGLLANQTGKPVHTTSGKLISSSQEIPDYVARRNLGNQLSSPKVTEEGSQANSRFTSPMNGNHQENQSAFHEGTGNTLSVHSPITGQR